MSWEGRCLRISHKPATSRCICELGGKRTGSLAYVGGNSLQVQAVAFSCFTSVPKSVHLALGTITNIVVKTTTTLQLASSSAASLEAEAQEQLPYISDDQQCEKLPAHNDCKVSKGLCCLNFIPCRCSPAFLVGIVQHCARKVSIGCAHQTHLLRVRQEGAQPARAHHDVGRRGRGSRKRC